MLTVVNTANNNIWLLLHNDGFIRLVGALPQSSLLFFANDPFPQPNGDKKKPIISACQMLHTWVEFRAGTSVGSGALF